jgi:ankyrin repeat protein
MTRIRLTAAIAFLACVAMAMAAGNQAGILDAARARDGAKVRALLAEGSDPKEVAADGSTALHWAAQWDDLETAAALLKAGADANAKNRYGSAPIMLAATNGSAPMLELLIQAGADPNTSIGEGETVLMTAAKTGRREAVEVLLLHGADVNAKEGWHGQTALMWAAGEGHDGAVEALTAAGAELASRSEGGFTAYLFAVRQGHSDVVQTLLDAGVDVNESLLVRRRRGRYPTGADDAASAERELGSSALDLAVANGHFELAALLLDRGADPNQAGPGWTPLHTISWVRNPGVGSNDPAPEGSGSMGSLELVRKLVQHGADVNFRMTRRSNAGRHSLNTVGATPFLAACRTADTELLQLLAELGADPLIPTEEGSTPLMVAAGLGTRAPDEDAGTPEEVVEAVKLVLALGGDPNVVNSNNDTAMHGAAYKHVAGVVPLLVAAGADINVWNIKNHLGWTPLRIATGVHRGMNLRASPETAAAIRKVMEEANVSTYVEPEGVISGETR